MIKIILLGKNGFIGSHLQTLMDNYPGSVKLDLPDFDILNFNSDDFSASYIDKNSKTIIINSIGLMGASISNEHPAKYLNINGIYIQKLINIAKNNSKIKFLNLSSETLYGPQDANNYPNENSPINPSHIYSVSKYIGEELLRISDCNHINLRIPIVIANSPKEENPFTTFNNSLLKNEKAIIFGDGEHYRKFVTLSRLTKLIKLIVNTRYWDVSGTFNVPGTKFKINEIYNSYIQINPSLEIEYKKNKKPYSLFSSHEKFNYTFEKFPIENFNDFYEELN